MEKKLVAEHILPRVDKAYLLYLCSYSVDGSAWSFQLLPVAKASFKIDDSSAQKILL